MKYYLVLFIVLVSVGQAFAAGRDVSLDMSYRRVLPLAQGSNFRDAGDYPTADGKRVVRGQLFRSAAMYAIDSQSDIDYLKQFKFKTGVDLRSNEERELQPDRWVLADQSINYVAHDYSIMTMLSDAKRNNGAFDMVNAYKNIHISQLPQLKLYFDALLSGQTPIILHCSAGQDRTGFISAMLLSALGVERDIILEDYQLSTDLRRPMIEKGNIDYAEAAKTNAFAKLMVAHGANKPQFRAKPLRTPSGKPFLSYTFDVLESDYGSVEGYLTRAVNLRQSDLKRLRELYTQWWSNDFST